MAFRNDENDYGWVIERNLRPRRSRADEDNGPHAKLSDRLVEWTTVAAGLAGVILLIDAVITALN